MACRTVLVVGGNGFVGAALAAELVARSGCNVVVPTRRYQRGRDLLPLPRLLLVEADVNDDATLARLLPGVDAVINLAGVLHSPCGPAGARYGPAFARSHVALTRRLVAACAAHGVRRYLHMSALGADADGPSMYLRSKGDGELAARADVTLAVTVFRPSVIFGPGDRFMNRLAALQRWVPLLPLAAAGARLQPVYVEDVACAFVNALDNHATIGRTYELAGPAVYTLADLARLAGAWSGHPRPVWALPAGLARLQAGLLEWLPGEPPLSRDNLDSMTVDNVAAGPIAPELGIAAVALEAVAPYYLAGRTPRLGLDARHPPPAWRAGRDRIQDAGALSPDR